MYKDYRIVAVTPAGRRRYMELLIPQIIALRPIIDEYRLWANTADTEDLAFMQTIAEQNPGFVMMERLSVKFNGNNSIYSFFKNCTDSRTIYVRFDDDVVLLDSADAFSGYLQYVIDHPEAFVVFANVLNNAILTHLHQRFGKIPLGAGKTTYHCLCDIGWRSPQFAHALHEEVLADPDLVRFRFDTPWLLYNHERVSVNCIAWRGAAFASSGLGIDGSHDEEEWLACTAPRAMGLTNAIYGGFVCVHYAFFTQRAHLDSTNILQRYKDLLLQRHKV